MSMKLPAMFDQNHPNTPNQTVGEHNPMKNDLKPWPWAQISRSQKNLIDINLGNKNMPPLKQMSTRTLGGINIIQTFQFLSYSAAVLHFKSKHC